jgi:hypothetical protein
MGIAYYKTLHHNMVTMKKQKQWTKEEVRKVQKLWNNSTLVDLATELKVTKQQLQSLVYAMRKVGFKLAKKRRNGYLGSLLKEVLNGK